MKTMEGSSLREGKLAHGNKGHCYERSAPGLTTSNKKLLVAPVAKGIATRSIEAFTRRDFSILEMVLMQRLGFAFFCFNQNTVSH